MVKNTLLFLEDVYDDQLLQVNITFLAPSSSTPSSSPSQDLDDRIVAAVEDAFKALPHGAVALASFSHITSTPAVILPVKRLVALCRRYGTQVVIDGAHALGHIPIDVRLIDADYYVTNGHKWLFSPKGTALLWVRKDKQHLVSPTTISYEGVGATRFQQGFSYQGTGDLSGLMSMAAALEWRAARPGGDKGVMDYIHSQAVRGGAILSKAWGTETLVRRRGRGRGRGRGRCVRCYA